MRGGEGREGKLPSPKFFEKLAYINKQKKGLFLGLYKCWARVDGQGRPGPDRAGPRLDVSNCLGGAVPGADKAPGRCLL